MNKAGQSEYSDESDVVICKKKISPPDSPRYLKCIGTTKSSISLQWMVPDDDGASDITGYVIERTESKRQSWELLSDNCQETVFYDENLKEGASFTYRVAAVTAGGQSPWSESASATAVCMFGEWEF